MTASPATKVSVIVQCEPLLVPVATAARLLSLSPRTFERLLAAHHLPRPCRIGRTRLWRCQDLKAFVDAGCRLNGRA